MGGGTFIRRPRSDRAVAEAAAPSVAQRHQIQKRGADGEAGKADEHHGDDRMPDKRDVAPQNGYQIFAVSHFTSRSLMEP